MPDSPTGLKARLRSDLTTAMKARDAIRSSTIRMVMTAVKAEEVSGDVARELSDQELVTVLTREAKKRREAATAYDDAGRGELADKERAELEVLSGYLPKQLSDEELTALIAEEVAASGASGRAAMGAVMKAVRGRVAGQADGGRVAAEVKRQLGA
ncbi:GatB/YqeY domain-containing protein [Kineosporia sp. J2-2]|uniref:GatB/YqeY domain-containing protein n=1 Tax=Kineosporia corallincola TaxID=2835133 RepID=A0ABS5T927_9ACTN|nr:GatB/YqeY domain-containing protein [Kineosporia corallincola]MBT0767333.1 GatB/YqeY domain-containing protein [Kineosporia corallincola]